VADSPCAARQRSCHALPVINGGDSITYAALSQYIALHNDWAYLVLDGKDWLDKPHMPFWITALFFKIGGISAFTYILPGFLFHLIGGYYTYRIARLFYGRETAWLSVLVYVSVFHLMDSSIEVKAETYLTGFIMVPAITGCATTHKPGSNTCCWARPSVRQR